MIKIEFSGADAETINTEIRYYISQLPGSTNGSNKEKSSEESSEKESSKKESSKKESSKKSSPKIKKGSSTSKEDKKEPSKEEVASGDLTKEDVTKALHAVNDKHGADGVLKLREILNSFGYSKVGDIEESNFHNVIASCEQALL